MRRTLYALDAQDGAASGGQAEVWLDCGDGDAAGEDRFHAL
jgi:hypothetical protein